MHGLTAMAISRAWTISTESLFRVSSMASLISWSSNRTLGNGYRVAIGTNKDMFRTYYRITGISANQYQARRKAHVEIHCPYPSPYREKINLSEKSRFEPFFTICRFQSPYLPRAWWSLLDWPKLDPQALHSGRQLTVAAPGAAHSFAITESDKYIETRES